MNCNFIQISFCLIVVLALISNAFAQPTMEMSYPQEGKVIQQKRFYSWEEGKRSGDDYERNGQHHDLLKRRVMQLSPDTWTTYFRL